MRLEEVAEAVAVLFPVVGIVIGAALYGGAAAVLVEEVAAVDGQVVEEVALAALAEEVLVVVAQVVVGKNILEKVIV